MHVWADVCEEEEELNFGFTNQYLWYLEPINNKSINIVFCIHSLGVSICIFKVFPCKHCIYCRGVSSGYSPLCVDSWLWNSGNCVSTGTLMVRRRRWPLHDAGRLSCKNKEQIGWEREERRANERARNSGRTTGCKYPTKGTDAKSACGVDRVQRRMKNGACNECMKCT